MSGFEVEEVSWELLQSHPLILVLQLGFEGSKKGCWRTWRRRVSVVVSIIMALVERDSSDYANARAPPSPNKQEGAQNRQYDGVPAPSRLGPPHKHGLRSPPWLSHAVKAIVRGHRAG